MRPSSRFTLVFLLSACSGDRSAPRAEPSESEPSVAAPAVEPGVAAPASPRAAAPALGALPEAPEEQAELAVRDYFRAMQRGDLKAMRALMGGEMALQLDRARAQKGDAAMSATVSRGMPLRTRGPARHTSGDEYVVECLIPGTDSRVTIDVRRSDRGFRLFRLSQPTQPPQAASPYGR